MSFTCEIDIEWVHGGNLFRMTCDEFDYDTFDNIKLFLYLPNSTTPVDHPAYDKSHAWVALQDNEMFAADFWDIPMQKSNDQWEEARREFGWAWANDNSGY